MRLKMFTHRFQISGLNLERFLNLLTAQAIPLLYLSRQDARTLLCECYSADLPAIKAIAGEKGWRIEKRKPLRLSALAKRLLKRPGILAGAALALAGVLFCSQFVWHVQITGAGAYQADLVSFLQESGYHRGVRRAKVNAAELESALLYRYPEIAWFHVYVTNVTLVVEVVPGVPLPERHSDEPGDLIASRNGIIASIQTFAGTPAVQPGDVVQKGDVLIRGEERSSDGMLRPVRAQGAVSARVWDSVSVQMPLYEIQSTETGNETVLTSVRTPWFSWPADRQPDYLAANLYISSAPVGGVFFPVTLQRSVFREVSMEYVPRNPEEVRSEAEQSALRQLKSALFGDEIIDKWVDCCMIEDDKLALSVTAERLVDIGVFSAP